ncbi:MAG: hypothetical protein GY772_27920, partial [bacterium]|nr:hypothetical protein [bacterium]
MSREEGGTGVVVGKNRRALTFRGDTCGKIYSPEPAYWSRFWISYFKRLERGISTTEEPP